MYRGIIERKKQQESALTYGERCLEINEEWRCEWGVGIKV
jgi:hypothetical protein